MNKQKRIQGAINLINAIMKDFRGSYTIDLLQNSDVHVDISIKGTPLTVDRQLFERIKKLIEELYDSINIAYKIEIDNEIQGLHANYIIWDDLIGEINVE